MNIEHKLISLRFIMMGLLLLLTACSNGGIRPGSLTPAGARVTGSVWESDSGRTTTATLTTDTTSTMAPTKMESTLPVDYQLVDWHEPMEVITPENLDRVKLLGKLVFTGSANPFGWSPDGSKLGVVDSEHGIFVLNAMTFEKIFSFSGFPFIAFSYDGKLLETGGLQFDLETGDPTGVPTFAAYPGYLTDIEFSPDGKYVVGAGTDRVDILHIDDYFIDSSR